MDVAVLGGTFAPPTVAHLALLRAGMEFCGADLGVWVPSAASYMRKWRPGSIPAKWFVDDAHREGMLRALCEAEPDQRADFGEMHRPGDAYTFDTLCALEAEYGGRATFLMGSDLIPTLPGWHRSKELLARFPIVAVSRGEGEAGEAAARAGLSGIRVMPFPEQYRAVSATEARALLLAGEWEKARELLHPAVYRYIEDHFPKD